MARGGCFSGPLPPSPAMSLRNQRVSPGTKARILCNHRRKRAHRKGALTRQGRVARSRERWACVVERVGQRQKCDEKRGTDALDLERIGTDISRLVDCGNQRGGGGGVERASLCLAGWRRETRSGETAIKTQFQTGGYPTARARHAFEKLSKHACSPGDMRLSKKGLPGTPSS